jgi:DnaK suppressor protein
MKRNDVVMRLRRNLLLRRDALRRLLDGELALLGGHQDDDETAKDDVVSQFAESESREIQAIESALERMRDGRYDTCEECGGKIPLARLQALPVAELCIFCQREREASLMELASASS